MVRKLQSTNDTLDTCESIALAFELRDISLLYAANPALLCDALQENQRLRILYTEPPPPSKTNPNRGSPQFISEMFRQLPSNQDPELSKLYRAYMANDNADNFDRIGNSILSAIAQMGDSAIQFINDLEVNNLYFKALRAFNELKRRELACQTLPSIPCWCDTSFSFLYCSAYTHKMIKDGTILDHKEKWENRMRKRHARPSKRQESKSIFRRNTNLAKRDGDKVDAGTFSCSVSGGIGSIIDGAQKMSDPKAFEKWAINNNFGKNSCIGIECCQEIPEFSIPEILALEMCLAVEVCLNDEAAIAEFSQIDFNIKITIALNLVWSDRLQDIPVADVFFKKKINLSKVTLKIFPFRGDVVLEFEHRFLLFKAYIAADVQFQDMRATAICSNDPCSKSYCRMALSEQEYHIKILLSLEIFPDQELWRQDFQKECSHIAHGTYVGAYYPNWKIYTQPDIKDEFQKKELSKISDVFLAFQTISYSTQFDVYYVDFTDPWGDLQMCLTESKDCSSDPAFESRSGQPVDIPECADGTIAVAPYLGYVDPNGGVCPLENSCINVQGPPNPRRRFDCYSTISLPKNDGRPAINGLMQFLTHTIRGENSGVKTWLSIGGWYDSAYFSVATSPEYMYQLVDSVKSWTDHFEFDGIDIDWEFPGFEHGGQPLPGQQNPLILSSVEETIECSQSECSFSRERDGQNMMNFLALLRSKLPKHKLSIAAPVFHMKKVVNLKTLCASLDVINLMTYDFHGAFSPISNHQAMIFDQTPNRTEKNYEIDRAVREYIDAGCDTLKIQIGIPFYARVLQGVESGDDPAKPGLYQPHQGSPSWADNGVISYSDLKERQGFKHYWDSEAQASWAYDAESKLFATYDSPQSVENKVNYIKRLGLGGAFYFMVGGDTEETELLDILQKLKE
ncbi:MAG: hypothetical protein SGCHY_002340 [Lobulomycetales sp.]